MKAEQISVTHLFIFQEHYLELQDDYKWTKAL